MFSCLYTFVICSIILFWLKFSLPACLQSFTSIGVQKHLATLDLQSMRHTQILRYNQQILSFLLKGSLSLLLLFTFSLCRKVLGCLRGLGCPVGSGFGCHYHLARPQAYNILEKNRNILFCECIVHEWKTRSLDQKNS